MRRLKIWVIFGASLLASASGILYGFFGSSHASVNGQRGGAVGTAIAVVFMVIARGPGMDLFGTARDLAAKRLAKQTEPPTLAEVSAQTDEVAKRLDRLADAILTDANEIKTANAYLALATFIGSLVAGYGDKIVEWMLRGR